MEGNIDVYHIYSICQGQYVMGPGGPVDMNILAIDSAMVDENIPEHLRYETKQRVRALTQHMLNLAYEESKQHGG